MSNLLLEKTPEAAPALTDLQYSQVLLKELADRGADIQAKSTLLRIIADIGQPVSPELVTDLESEWLGINSEVRKETGEDPDLIKLHQDRYSISLRDSIGRVRTEFVESSLPLFAILSLVSVFSHSKKSKPVESLSDIF